MSLNILVFLFYKKAEATFNVFIFKLSDLIFNLVFQKL